MLGTGSRWHRLGQTGAENGQGHSSVGKRCFFTKMFAEHMEPSDLGQDNHPLLALLFQEALCFGWHKAAPRVVQRN